MAWPMNTSPTSIQTAIEMEKVRRTCRSLGWFRDDVASRPLNASCTNLLTCVVFRDIARRFAAFSFRSYTNVDIDEERRAKIARRSYRFPGQGVPASILRKRPLFRSITY